MSDIQAILDVEQLNRLVKQQKEYGKMTKLESLIKNNPDPRKLKKSFDSKNVVSKSIQMKFYHNY